jgi:hypothetical protein
LRLLPPAQNLQCNNQMNKRVRRAMKEYNELFNDLNMNEIAETLFVEIWVIDVIRKVQRVQKLSKDLIDIYKSAQMLPLNLMIISTVSCRPLFPNTSKSEHSSLITRCHEYHVGCGSLIHFL